ncbi:MAG TPA: tetratricopeptide repeat protein [Acidobacteriota bacterium]|jgi:serine/threonine-protein kinase
MEPQEFNRQAVRQQLERVFSSAGFVHNERLSRFLRFVVEQHLEGKDSELKESLIAVEVFGRKPDFDPKLDAIVRTEAVRLRARLSKYYASEGSGDPLIIELPKGGYIPVFRQVEAAREERKTRFGRLWVTVALSALAIALSAIGWWGSLHRSAPIDIAVVPLDNLSRDPADDYFADGLSDEIIRNLSVIDGLAVRSRTSSFALKGKPRNVREAGRQLGASYILEGSVLRAGQRLRINAQLVRVRDDFTLWSGRFDRELTDVFAIQDEIALGIVNNLRLKLGRGRRRYETSVEAYDLYLRARAHAFNVDALDQAIRRFEQVISKDSSFAPAYAGLASAYAQRSVVFPLDHPADELLKMRTAAEKAIQLDPLLAEAHDALGMVYAREGEWEQAEKSFRRAIELDRNRSGTYIDYGYWLLAVLGRLDEALQQLHAAEKADPLAHEVRGVLATVLISAGRYDEAADYCLKLPADNPFKSQFLARARFGQGRTGEALHLLTNDPHVPRNPQGRGFLGYVYARSGRREEAEKMAAASNYPNEQALIFAGLGDKERTLEAVDRMTALGPQRVGLYLNYPELALLRGDPRVKTFRKKIGLPE